MAKLNWNEKIRKALHKDKRSIYRLSKDSGLGIGPLQRFDAGENGLTVASAEKLCKLLGWELRPIEKTKGR